MKSCAIVRIVTIVVAGSVSSSRAQTCVDNTCFIDRGATGEINLGRIRGGLAVVDYDNDDFPDLVIADVNGLPSRLFHNVADPLRPGNRTFLDASAGSGIDDEDGARTSRFGAVAADYDNDGDVDVFMTGVGDIPDRHGLLYRNDGARFVNVSDQAGIRPSPPGNPLAASWCDYDLDGWLDLTIVSQLDAPNGLRLLHNEADGTFRDQSAVVPPLDVPGNPYSHSWVDYDADGWPDLLIPVSGGPVVLRNIADGAGGRTFIDATAESGFTAVGPAPMGTALGDYDNDGDFDLAVSDASIGTYYENTGGRFQAAFPFVTAFAWGLTWLDADNDGDLDHYQCGRYPGFRPDSLRLNQGDGTWLLADAALNGVNAASQHSVQLDFNNDGRRDLVTLNPGSPATDISVLENISTAPGHWIGIRLRGDGEAINRDAIGSIVRLTAGGVTQSRLLLSGSSTTATEDTRLHFGLGSATVVDQIEVLWPAAVSLSARTEVFEGPFAIDGYITLSPRFGACCVCAMEACRERSRIACERAGGRFLTDRLCSEIECALAAPLALDAPTIALETGPQSRFLSIVPGNPGRRTAVRVTLASLLHPDPPNLEPSADFTAFESQIRWLGPPRGFLEGVTATSYETAAELACDPYFMDWGQFAAVHAFGSAVVPSSAYVVELFDAACGADLDDPSAYSGPLLAHTAAWGDVVAPFQPSCAELGCVPCTLSCRSQPNALDIVAVVDRFRARPGAPGKPATRLQPLVPDPMRDVNALDVAAAVQAFRGQPYSYPGPTSCP